MCAASTLLNPLAMPAKTKLESIDQMFETSCYSYLTRCSDPMTTLRALSLAVELFRSRGGSATERAARWAMRIMELSLVGSVGQILFSERVSICYASKTPLSGARWGGRRRKAGMWSVLAADLWLKAGKPTHASACLEEAERLYAEFVDADGSGFPMRDMQLFINDLKHTVQVECVGTRGLSSRYEDVDVDNIAEFESPGTEETSEKLDRRHHRRSLIGLPLSVDTASNPPTHATRADILETSRVDDFERA